MSLERTMQPRREKPARVVAMIATYNEERFIAGCLEHLFNQGVEVYLIDNCSTDRTTEIAERYRESGLLGMETLPRAEKFDLSEQLRRKEELAATFEADWIMHVDADEVHLPPRSDQTLAQAFAEVEAAGYNAVDFQEFTFLPTEESPDHDHSEYQSTMRWYYPFTPFSPRLMRAWRQQSVPVSLSRYGGHKIDFPGMKLWPEKFPMKHYLFLSAPHILNKYAERNFDRAEVRRGWHGWRARLEAQGIRLPSQAELRFQEPEGELDASNPREHHVTEEWVKPENGLRRWTKEKAKLLRDVKKGR